MMLANQLFSGFTNGKQQLINSSVGKESACNAGDPSSFLGWEDPLGKEMATHSSILAWRILYLCPTFFFFSVSLFLSSSSFNRFYFLQQFLVHSNIEWDVQGPLMCLCLHVHSFQHYQHLPPEVHLLQLVNLH